MTCGTRLRDRSSRLTMRLQGLSEDNSFLLSANTDGHIRYRKEKKSVPTRGPNQQLAPIDQQCTLCTISVEDIEKCSENHQSYLLYWVFLCMPKKKSTMTRMHGSREHWEQVEVMCKRLSKILLAKVISSDLNGTPPCVDFQKSWRRTPATTRTYEDSGLGHCQPSPKVSIFIIHRFRKTDK